MSVMEANEMTYDSTAKCFGFILTTMLKGSIKDKETIKAVKAEYKAIVERASDIGNHNFLIMSYYLAAYFIAMNRNTGLSPEENLAIMEEKIKTSKLIKLMMGNAKDYLSEKKMQIRREWSKETYKMKYKNDWVVDVIEKDDKYEFGLDYHQCGVCKLCRDEGCFELAKYLCRLDFLLVEVIGVHLDRTMVLAEGAPKCDFRFRK